MTYCVALRLDTGMIFASDSRTNAGVDHIATFSKMRVYERKDDRVIVVLSSGNLAMMGPAAAAFLALVESARRNGSLLQTGE